MHGLWLVQVGATLAMVGVIWVVQLVHYPLFAHVGADRFGAYHAAHVQRITWIVGPLMLAELATALWCLSAPPTRALGWWPFALGVALIAIAWLTTALASVPYHNTLASGPNPDALAGLVHTNWPRTLAWTARGALVLWITAAMIVE